MSRRHADIWSHPSHYLVDPCTWPWWPNGHSHGHEWRTPIHFVQCQSVLPIWDTAISKFYHENPWSKPCVWSKVKATFDLENSKVRVMAKVKPNGHMWGLEFNWYICYLFHQSSHKNLRKKFHDFSMTSPGLKFKFPDKIIPIFVFAAHVSNCRINYRQTQTHTHTHMIWSRSTNYSTDFTSN